MSFSFVQITDHHLLESETDLVQGFSTWYSFRKVLKHIAEHVGSQIDFIVSMGDLVDPPSVAGYRTVTRALSVDSTGAEAPGPLNASAEGLRDMPTYFLPGNHDDLTAMMQVLFPASPPIERLNVVFEHKGVRFVCLDWGREPFANAGEGMFGFLDEATRDGAPVIVLTHHPVMPVGVRWLDRFLAPDVHKFWETISGRHVLGVLSGHVHMSMEKVINGVPVSTTASTGFQFGRQSDPMIVLEPPQYRLVSVRGGAMTTETFNVAL